MLFVVYSNLKKCEESVSRVQAELEENEKSMVELTEQLKKLEDEAGEIMKACQEAEVGSFSLLSYLHLFISITKSRSFLLQEKT